MTPTYSPKVIIRGLRDSELADADHIFRLAFATFLGLPDPLKFSEDHGPVTASWRADPESVLAVEMDGRLIGSNVVTTWGTFGFFGPLTIHPEYWEKGAAQRLLEATMDRFERLSVRYSGLYTFTHSPKHIHLYQKFGYWPRFLTPILSKPADPCLVNARFTSYSSLTKQQREEFLRASQDLSNSLLEGMDLSAEIRAAERLRSGDTISLWSESKLRALAICYFKGHEPPKTRCYVKFAAVCPKEGGDDAFDELLSAIDALASGRGVAQIEAGMNMVHAAAYRRMMVHGFSTQYIGVAMQRPNQAGHKRPELYVIDDWR